MPRATRWTARLALDHADNLAVFRIVVGALIVATRHVHDAARWAALPASLRVAPRGWAWALALVPPRPDLAQLAHAVLVAAAVAGALGVFARASFAVVTVAALWLLALPQCSGTPFHYHHLVWFAALLAASPCGDALSVDAWRRRRTAAPATPSACYGVPLRAAWLLLGAVFFFPGLWKLGAVRAWVFSDNLRNQMYWKWALTPGFHPLFRIDRYPALCRAAAAAVVLFELVFPFAVFARRLRPWAVAAALAFHAAVWALMALDFSALWVSYAVFVDWHPWIARVRARLHAAPRAVSPVARAAWPALLVGAFLVAGACEAGARGATLGWPFACYPTFHHVAASAMPAVRVALLDARGGERALSPASLGDGPRDRALGWRLAALAPGRPDTLAQLRGYWSTLAPRPDVARALALERPCAVRFYSVLASVVPEARGALVGAPVWLGEFALDATAATPRARNGATTCSASERSASAR